MKYVGEHEFAFDTERLGFPSIDACRAIVYQTVEYRRVGQSSIVFASPWDDKNATNKGPTSGPKSDQPDHLMRGARAARYVRQNVDKTRLVKLDPVSLR